LVPRDGKSDRGCWSGIWTDSRWAWLERKRDGMPFRCSRRDGTQDWLGGDERATARHPRGAWGGPCQCSVCVESSVDDVPRSLRRSLWRAPATAGGERGASPPRPGHHIFCFTRPGSRIVHLARATAHVCSPSSRDMIRRDIRSGGRHQPRGGWTGCIVAEWVLAEGRPDHAPMMPSAEPLGQLKLTTRPTMPN